MELAISNIESHSSHILFAKNSLFGCPLESRNHRLFDFVHVLDSLGDIDNDVGSTVFGTETPDLTGIIFLPIELFTKPE